MKVVVYKKDFYKENPTVKTVIFDAVRFLGNRIEAYEKQNVSFDKIFNDDKIKYDKHGEFYTFKYHKEHIQIRILYAYVIVDNVAVIILADYIQKKKNNKNEISISVL